jgi:hypothetical protein
MVKYIFTTKAYVKIILHSCKHSTSTINGLLLSEDTLSSSNNNADDQIVITDAIPLFHHWTTLTPMLEVGLQQVKK